MTQPSVEKQLFIIGAMPSPIKRNLAYQYRVNITHLEDEATIRVSLRVIKERTYQAILITDALPPKVRDYILRTVSARPDANAITIGVLTDETSFNAWLAIPLQATAADIATQFGLEEQGRPAQIVVVTNTKGGVGKSFLATNVAVALGALGLKVALLEDDWTTRSVKGLMGIDDTDKISTHLVGEIQAQQGLVTPQLMMDYLVDAHGVHCLIGPPNIITEHTITPTMAKDIIAMMGHELGFDVIVIDAPPDFIHTSCFTYGLLSKTNNTPTPPLILVPVVPETTILRSAHDTLDVVRHMHHPDGRIWPVINCIKAEHDPDMLRGRGGLWMHPVSIIPYCPDAQFVGDRRRPLFVEAPGTWPTRLFRKLMGVATIPDVRTAYLTLAEQIQNHLGGTADAP